ncbi:MAG: glycosyltransferase family 2 protein [Deltaproteobacteria bacterium]|nr:glycosyltransferase family 2 protein [Deltaproteobacteria bacterium]
MWSIPLYIILIPLTLYLTASTLYLIFLAVAYFVVREREAPDTPTFNRFAILVPAHDEELLISQLCESLLKINYPVDHFEIFIIADNCGDRTVENAGAFPVQTLIRNDPSHAGKGYAIDWALDQIDLQKYGAVFVVDADNTVDGNLLTALNASINNGERAIQCYNTIANRSDSWFSEILFVSRTVNNLLYHDAKYKLGLSSYLTGNGMCFRTDLLREVGWKAFSIGEDWEYYAKLIERRIKVAFAKGAKVFHQESTSLEQATSQRLRWSSGRFAVFKNSGLKLFLKGLRNKDWFTMDASLPLVFPNYSLQVNLTLMTLVCSLILPSGIPKNFIIYSNAGLLILLLALFGAGVYLSGRYLQVLKALLRVPLFLLWKSIIDILSFTGIYKTKRWIRTKRSAPSRKDG